MPPTGPPNLGELRRLCFTLLLLPAFGLPPSPVGARARATLELGPGYEYTNLVYRSNAGTIVTDPNDSTAFVVNDSLVISETPEGAAGGFARFSVRDTLAPGRWYSFQPEARVQQDYVNARLGGALRWGLGPSWTAGFDQRFEHTRDARFGALRVVDSEVFTGVLGYWSPDRAWRLDVRPRVQVDRTSRTADSYFQDNQGGQLALGLSHLSEAGGFYTGNLDLATRTYPDSSLRNYRDALASLRADRPLGSGFSVNGAGELERRWGDSGEVRHDLFQRWRADAGSRWSGLTWAARLSGSAEHLGYRNPDEVYYNRTVFDLQVAMGPTLENGLSLELRPRASRLAAGGALGEEYRTLGLSAAMSWFGDGIVDLTLGAARRHYLDPASAAASGHSDFHSYEASAFLSRTVVPGVRLRLNLDYELERHDLPEDNNHLVYFGGEVSYGFGGGSPR